MERRYSAADLIKCSARQMVFLAQKKERIATYLQKKGIQYQSKIVDDEKNHGVVAEEMRGCYSYNDEGNNDKIEIFFCIDMIKDGQFYEIKMNKDKEGNERSDYDEWYFNISILQCAFYKSLIMRMDGDMLFTPKFRIKEGYEKAKLKIDKNNDYILRFGTIGDFKVNVNEPDKIIDFYKKKIDYLWNYNMASEFDDNYKRKEFEKLRDCFTFQKLK